MPVVQNEPSQSSFRCIKKNHFTSTANPPGRSSGPSRHPPLPCSRTVIALHVPHSALSINSGEGGRMGRLSRDGRGMGFLYVARAKKDLKTATELCRISLPPCHPIVAKGIRLQKRKVTQFSRNNRIANWDYYSRSLLTCTLPKQKGQNHVSFAPPANPCGPPLWLNRLALGCARKATLALAAPVKGGSAGIACGAFLLGT